MKSKIIYLSFLFLFLYYQGYNQNLQELKKENETLRVSIKKLEKLKNEIVEDLEYLEAISRLIKTQRDSLARLLAYSLQNERIYKAKNLRFQAMLEDLQGKFDSLSRKYQYLTDGNGNSIAELQGNIESLTRERNGLVKENQELKTELLKVKGNINESAALFVTSISATPKTIYRGSIQEIDKIEIALTLNRSPKPQESLLIRLFDANYRDIVLRTSYRNDLYNAHGSSQLKIKIKPENYKFAIGNYSVYIYMTNVEKGIEDVEIGMTEFTLK